MRRHRATSPHDNDNAHIRLFVYRTCGAVIAGFGDLSSCNNHQTPYINRIQRQTVASDRSFSELGLKFKVGKTWNKDGWFEATDGASRVDNGGSQIFRNNFPLCGSFKH